MLNLQGDMYVIWSIKPNAYKGSCSLAFHEDQTKIIKQWATAYDNLS